MAKTAEMARRQVMKMIFKAMALSVPSFFFTVFAQ
jgi:hypothetical protein